MEMWAGSIPRTSSEGCGLNIFRREVKAEIEIWRKLHLKVVMGMEKGEKRSFLFSYQGMGKHAMMLKTMESRRKPLSN